MLVTHRKQSRTDAPQTCTIVVVMGDIKKQLTFLFQSKQTTTD